MEFSRIAFAYKSDEGHRARISLMQTPTQDQILFDGRVKLSEQLAAQAAVDDSGNFRARLLLEGSGCGLSLGGGRTGEETIANFSAHTERAWLSGSYGTARGAQCRLVFGDIPKNRSELAGEFTSPGANDISLYPDQTIRPSIGANPSFGLLAASPHAFLAEETGSFVLDFQIQENIRISGRAALRMGDLGAAKQAWVAVGAFQNLIQDEPGISLEAGATLWGGSVRILTEVKDEPTIGLMFSIPF
jgi:hypothetical protein